MGRVGPKNAEFPKETIILSQFPFILLHGFPMSLNIGTCLLPLNPQTVAAN
jgi:hypothetical protein